MKRPAFQFYPADWRRDSALQSCSLEARGLWIEMLCVMHDCTPYGVLEVNGTPLNEARLARLIGEAPDHLGVLLDELESAGVFGRTAAGAIYSRRMMKDEHIREVRSQAGKLGGNPVCLSKIQANIKQTAKQSPTPSSSSSTATARSKERNTSCYGSECDSDALAADTDESNRATDAATAVRSACPTTRIIALYHEILPMCPRVEKITKARAGYIRQRWTDDLPTLEAWRNYFTDVSHSPFLTGRVQAKDGKPPFIADLEWLTRPGNFAKVLEGRYHR